MLLFLSASCCAASLPRWAEEASAQAVPPEFADAGAVILLHSVDVRPIEGGAMEESHRFAARIQDPRNASGFLPLLVLSLGDRIESVHGWNRDAEGKVVKLKESQGIEFSLSSSHIDDVRQFVLSSGALERGTVVAYEFSITRVLAFGGDGLMFDRSFPSLDLRVCFSDPAPPHRASGEPEPAVKGACLAWNRVPDLEEEPWAPPESDLLPRVDYVRHRKTWEEIGAGYLATVPLPGPLALAPGAAPASPAFADAALVIGAVQNEVRYVAVELGRGAYTPTPPAETYARRWGDCKDKSYLAISALAHLGLRAYPLLTRFSRDGEVAPDLPALYHFNHMIAAVEIPPHWKETIPSALTVGADRYMVVDLTDTLTPVGLLSEELQGVKALLLRPGQPAFVDLPLPPPEHNRITERIHIAFEGRRAIIESWESHWGGRFAAEKSLYHLEHPDEIKKRFQSGLRSILPQGVLLEFTQDSRRKEEPYETAYRVSDEGFLRNAAGYVMCSPVFSKPGVGSSFTQKPRQNPVALPSNRAMESVITVEVPPGLALQDLPPDQSIATDLFSYSIVFERGEGSVTVKRRLLLRRAVLPAERFPEIKKKYDSVVKADASALLFKAATP